MKVVSGLNDVSCAMKARTALETVLDAANWRADCQLYDLGYGLGTSAGYWREQTLRDFRQRVEAGQAIYSAECAPTDRILFYLVVAVAGQRFFEACEYRDSPHSVHLYDQGKSIGRIDEVWKPSKSQGLKRILDAMFDRGRTWHIYGDNMELVGDIARNAYYTPSELVVRNGVADVGVISVRKTTTPDIVLKGIPPRDKLTALLFLANLVFRIHYYPMAFHSF